MSLFQCPREIVVLFLLDDAVDGDIVRNGGRVFQIILVSDDNRLVGLVVHGDICGFRDEQSDLYNFSVYIIPAF